MRKKIKLWWEKHRKPIKIGLIWSIIGIFVGFAICDSDWRKRYPDDGPDWVDTDSIPYSQEDADRYLGG